MTRNIEALQQLRRVVSKAPSHRFHMNRVVERTDCGTARCALGWAAIDKWFQKNTELSLLIAPTVSDLFRFEVGRARGIFGISATAATNLFGGDLNAIDGDPHGVSKAEVLWNIDRILAGKPTRPYAASNACINNPRLASVPRS